MQIALGENILLTTGTIQDEDPSNNVYSDYHTYSSRKIMSLINNLQSQIDELKSKLNN